MNTRTKLLLCLALIASAMTLVTCKTSDEEANYVGTWFASNVETPSLANQDVEITLTMDGTYETLFYNVGGSTLQSGSSRGTYTCANNILCAQGTEQYNGSEWVPTSGTTSVAYSVSEDGNTLTLFQDFYGDEEIDAIWTLTRQ